MNLIVSSNPTAEVQGDGRLKENQTPTLTTFRQAPIFASNFLPSLCTYDDSTICKVYPVSFTKEFPVDHTARERFRSLVARNASGLLTLILHMRHFDAAHLTKEGDEIRSTLLSRIPLTLDRVLTPSRDVYKGLDQVRKFLARRFNIKEKSPDALSDKLIKLGFRVEFGRRMQRRGARVMSPVFAVFKDPTAEAAFNEDEEEDEDEEMSEFDIFEIAAIMHLEDCGGRVHMTELAQLAEDYGFAVDALRGSNRMTVTPEGWVTLRPSNP
jgi:hypothetical protein